VSRISSGIHADLVDLSCMLSPSGSAAGLAGASPEGPREEVCAHAHARWPLHARIAQRPVPDAQMPMHSCGANILQAGFAYLGCFSMVLMSRPARLCH
jgi:hypothetical protein